MLVIDSDLDVSRREQAGWMQNGIPTVRVDTMCEGVKRLGAESFLFTAINADTIHYLPMLKIMDEVSPTPILIITSAFTVYDQVEALHHGADAYVPFSRQVDENIMLALALINRYNARGKRPYHPPRTESYEKLLFSPGSSQVFCGNEEIPLTEKEFNILMYLFENRGIVLTYNQIFHRAWGNGYGDASHGTLWNHIIRIRKKLARFTGGDGYIENLRNVGYKLPAYNGKQASRDSAAVS